MLKGYSKKSHWILSYIDNYYCQTVMRRMQCAICRVLTAQSNRMHCLNVCIWIAAFTIWVDNILMKILLRLIKMNLSNNKTVSKSIGSNCFRILIDFSTATAWKYTKDIDYLFRWILYRITFQSVMIVNDCSHDFSVDE